MDGRLALSHLASCFALIGITSIAAADLTEDWSLLYDGPSSQSDQVSQITADDSGVTIVGDSVQNGSNTDAVVIRFDQAGQFQWSVGYHGPGNGWSYGDSFDTDAAGNTYVAGYNYGGSPNTRFIMMKVSPAGQLLWSDWYAVPGSYSNIASDATVDTNGNLFFTGWTRPLSSNGDMVTVKVDTNGNTLWHRVYAGPGSGFGGGDAIATDSVGNVYVAGRIDGGNTNNDVAIVKYDTNGNLLWDEQWDGVGYSDTVVTIAVGSDDAVYIAGHFQGENHEGQSAYVLKYDASGAFQWMWSHTGDAEFSETRLQDMIIDDADNLYVAGEEDNDITGSDAMVGMLNGAGQEQWLQSFNLEDGWEFMNDEASAIALMPNGHIVATGASERLLPGLPFGDGPATEEGVMLYEFDADGVMLSTLFTPRDGYTRDISVAPNGDIYAAGTEWTPDSEADALVMKYIDPFVDCNGNGVHDPDDIDSGDAQDCNGNGIPDSCDLDSGFSNDCDDDGQLDECQISTNPRLDTDGTGILDSCELVGDLDGSGATDIEDLLIFLGAWGPCSDPCPADLDDDGTVGILDLLTLLGYYG